MATAYEIPGFRYTLVAGADLSEKRYCVMAVDANGKAVPLTVATGVDFAGILQTPETIDHPVQVMKAGISFIKLGGTVANGATVTVNADSACIARTTEALVVGIALCGGTVGQIGCVLLK